MRAPIAFCLILCQPLFAAQGAKEIRELAKEGADSIPKLREYLQDPSAEIRVEAVKALALIGTQHSLAPLTAALRDADPEVQIRAADGLVSFYLPGYAADAFSSSIKRSDKGISGKFPDKDEWVVDAFVQARPEVIQGLRDLLKAPGAAALVRANAARALGVLRARAAAPDLVEALHSKDDQLIYQAVLAIQKMGAREVAPRILFLTRDLDERIQIAAIETVGLLGDKAALPDLRRVLESNPKTKVRRAALTSMAMLPDASYRSFYGELLRDKDEYSRAAGAEGLGRIRNPEDRALLEAAWEAEKKTVAQLSLAFGLTALGHTETGEGSPLEFLTRHLGSKAWRGVAQPLLVELARHQDVRRGLLAMVNIGDRDQRVGLMEVLGLVGEADAVPVLEPLTRDSDTQIAGAASLAVRRIRARR